MILLSSDSSSPSPARGSKGLTLKLLALLGTFLRIGAQSGRIPYLGIPEDVQAELASAAAKKQSADGDLIGAEYLSLPAIMGRSRVLVDGSAVSVQEDEEWFEGEQLHGSLAFGPGETMR